MQPNEESRLDRLEALVESILQGLQETIEGLRETREGLRETREGLRETREGLRETREGLEKGLQETRAIANSNARSIEALTEERIADQRKAQLEREKINEAIAELYRTQAYLARTQADAVAELYRAQANLADAQAGFASRLSSQDELIQTLSRRQGEIVDIMKILVQKS